MPDGESESEARSVDRLTFFSDAVVAIAITLLAIDLPVPEGGTLSAFLTSVRHNSGHYLAFLISFAAIAAAWSHHHDIFRYTRRMDPRLRSMNTIWLMMIVLNPFATRMLTSQSNHSLSVHAVRFGFYALLQALVSLMMIAMLRHMLSRDQAPGIPESVANDTGWQSYGLVLGFGISVPVFFATSYAWVLWIAVPLIVRRVYQFRHRHQRDPEV